MKSSEIEALFSKYGVMEKNVKDDNKPLLKTRYEYLEDWINASKYEKIIELGAGSGIPAIYLLERCGSIKEYIAVDPESVEYLSRKEGFPKFLIDKYKDKLKFVKTTAFEASSLFPDGYFDLIYLDFLGIMSHKFTPGSSEGFEECKKNILAWIPKVRKNGMLCSHDYIRKMFKNHCNALEEVFPDGVNLIKESSIYMDTSVSPHKEISLYLWWKYM